MLRLIIHIIVVISSFIFGYFMVPLIENEHYGMLATLAFYLLVIIVYSIIILIKEDKK